MLCNLFYVLRCVAGGKQEHTLCTYAFLQQFPSCATQILMGWFWLLHGLNESCHRYVLRISPDNKNWILFIMLPYEHSFHNIKSLFKL